MTDKEKEKALKKQTVEEFTNELLSELEEQKQFYDKSVKYHKEESIAAMDFCIKAVKELSELYGDEKQNEQDKEQNSYEDIAEW